MQSLAEAKPVDLHPHYTEITEYDLVLLFSDLGIQDTLLDKLLRENRENPTFLAYLLEAKAQRLIDQGKNREGRDSLYKSLDIRTKEKDTLSMGMNRYNLAISFSNEENYEEASVQMEMAMALYESQQQETRFAEALTSLSILANAKNETDEALKYGQEAYTYAIEANDLEDAARAATQLVALYEKIGRYDSAFHYQIRYREHRDALNVHREAAIQIAEENRRKAEVQAVNLENFKKTQRLINMAVGALITILLILIFLIVRQAIQKRKLAEYKLQEKETAQKYLQYQRKGEFIERQRMAHDLHDGLGQILNSANTMLGIVGNEAESLREEVLIQFHKAEDWIKEANKNLRLITQNKSKEAYSGFGIGGWAHELKDRIESSSSMQVQVDLLDLNEPLKEDAELELILIMQELVNNAQKYSNGKFLTIQIIREGADLNMMIEDDGQGFDTQKALRKKSSGLGLESMKRRVENNLGGTIVFDSVMGQGTSVVIQIPHIFLLNNKNENHV
jgi:signal transduction histidine kinase